jgi:hypothetical protein
LSKEEGKGREERQKGKRRDRTRGRRERSKTRHDTYNCKEPAKTQ